MSEEPQKEKGKTGKREKERERELAELRIVTDIRNCTDNWPLLCKKDLTHKIMIFVAYVLLRERNTDPSVMSA